MSCSTRKIGDFTEGHLLKVSKDIVAKKTANSMILDVKAEERIPKFNLQGKRGVAETIERREPLVMRKRVVLADVLSIFPMITQFHPFLVAFLCVVGVFEPPSTNNTFLLITIELQIGKVLGRGGFCVVKEVTKITLLQQEQTNGNNQCKSDDEHYIANIVQDRGFMAQHCIRKGKDYRYAIKMVQTSSRKEPQLYINAVVDLAVEARFLSVVRHPNIIKMRAMEGMGSFQPTFFVVLDRLYDIMPVRITKWKKRAGNGLRAMLKSKKVKEAFFVERLTVAYDIACALMYLHGLK
jgi:hypothetical protein